MYVTRSMEITTTPTYLQLAAPSGEEEGSPRKIGYRCLAGFPKLSAYLRPNSAIFPTFFSPDPAINTLF